jgi:hypothetical protein
MKKLSLILLISGFATLAQAGNLSDCISECEDTYESDIQSCNLIYDEPSDIDSLSMCIHNAADEFDSCKMECES